MTTDEALERLRPDWSLSRGEDYQTDVTGWEVCLLMNGEQMERLGFGATIADAIEAAEIKVAENEREQAERDCRYAERKARGELTPLERADEYTAALWSAAALNALEPHNVLADRVNRAFEGEIQEMGKLVEL